MNNKSLTLQLDSSTSTTGNAEQVAQLIGASGWHISGDYLIVEDPLFDYRVTDGETYSGKLDHIQNGAIVKLYEKDVDVISNSIDLHKWLASALERVKGNWLGKMDGLNNRV